MSLGAECYLTSMCFADDVVLLAAKAKHIREMIADLRAAAAERGLKIHSGKTKVLPNEAAASSTRLPAYFEIDGEKYAVLGPEDSAKYLGRKVRFKDPNLAEFDNRVAKAWGAFSKYKKELTDRQHRLKDRLKLFDAVITPTLLYGCESWTLRVDQQKRLRTLQRKMLRMVLNAKRRILTPEPSSATDVEADKDDGEDEYSEPDELEPWQEFLQRTARWTEEQLDKANLQQWTVQWRRRKWAWAAKLLDKDNHKWSAVATKWQPLLHTDGPCGRRHARPKRRWEQDFVDYLRVACPSELRHWHELAADQNWWESHSETFASF